jgi:hypothetical protein
MLCGNIKLRVESDGKVGRTDGEVGMWSHQWMMGQREDERMREEEGEDGEK